MSLEIDLNADLGEGFDDAAVLPSVSSCNIACGGHAGDTATMLTTLTAAKKHGVACGAHPSYPDRENFGRRELPMTLSEIADSVTGQIEALLAVARGAGVTLSHVKPHGALYHVCNRRRDTARVFAETVARRHPRLILVGFAGSLFLEEGKRAGLRTAGEAFADRRYLEDGTLAPRESDQALIRDPVAAAAQAVGIVRENAVRSLSGQELPVHAQTICLHGDTPAAAAIAQSVRQGVEKAGIAVRNLSSQKR